MTPGISASGTSDEAVSSMNAGPASATSFRHLQKKVETAIQFRVQNAPTLTPQRSAAESACH